MTDSDAPAPSSPGSARAALAQTIDRARQGNPEAIAALMGRTLQKEGMAVRAARSPENELVFDVEAIAAPDPERLLSFVERLLAKLGLTVMEPRAIVRGQVLGADAPAWERTLTLAGRPANPPGQAASLSPEANDESVEAETLGTLDPAKAPGSALSPAGSSPAGESRITLPRMNFADLQKVVGKVADLAIQPEPVGEFAGPGPIAGEGDGDRVRATVDRAFDALEVSIAQVRSRRLPVDRVALGTKIDLGAIEVTIGLDVPTAGGSPRVVSFETRGEAADLARSALQSALDAEAPDPTAPPGEPPEATDGEGANPFPDLRSAGLNSGPTAGESPTLATEDLAADAPPGSAPGAAGAPDTAALLQRGMACYRSGDLTGAIAQLNAVVRRAPETAEAYRLLAGAFSQQGKSAEALLALKIARDLYAARENDGAVAEIDRQFAQSGLDPHSPAFHCVLGVVLYNQGDAAGAIAELRQAIAGDAEDPEAHKILGGILGKQGQPEAARASLRRAQTLYLKRGDGDAAREIDRFLQAGGAGSEREAMGDAKGDRQPKPEPGADSEGRSE